MPSIRPAPALGLLAGLLLTPAAASAEPFVFVSLPDTQVYAEDRLPDGRLPAVTDPRGTGAIFYDQTRWVVENAERLGIRYVGHLGDIVQDGNDLGEWALAHDAMHRLLEADVPHGTVMGNHDDNHGPDYQRNYLDHFGPQRFQDRPWYVASSPGGGANLQILEHRHRRIGFLNFSIDHPQAEIDWATQVVQDHPDTIFIIGTHRYLYDFKIAAGRYGEDVDSILGPFNVQDGPVPGAVEPNSAQELFDEFVSQHANVLMIHAGHFHAEWLRLDETNGAAQMVIQILTDYQSTRNGGDGWLRLYELDFDEDVLRFDTYSPTLDRRRSTLDHFVETIHLAYAQRDQIAAELGVSVSLYLGLLDALFKDGPAPDGFLLQHPDLDEPHEQAYYAQYLEDLFLGAPPPGFDDILEWEKLWLLAFAADPGDPFDFSASVRSPRFAIPVDFSAYFTPNPRQRVAFAFEALLEALGGLGPDGLAFPAAGHVLAKRAEHAFRLAESGKLARARHALAHTVLRRTDGCAERGRPDAVRPPRRARGAPDALDWIDGCAAQAGVHPRVVETIDALESAAAP